MSEAYELAFTDHLKVLEELNSFPNFPQAARHLMPQRWDRIGMIDGGLLLIQESNLGFGQYPEPILLSLADFRAREDFRAFFDLLCFCKTTWLVAEGLWNAFTPEKREEFRQRDRAIERLRTWVPPDRSGA